MTFLNLIVGLLKSIRQFTAKCNLPWKAEFSAELNK